ncbi:4-hydroxy-3-methylbut-2-enyl diphosphate reductase [uncultured Slackia sp.]|uniref:4-hydroxy-3-methylbut-2-enyl diphosphate reductase n=1 Tax=uncultured Slackia sp. TaxID=665903 RepID=UPI0026E0E9E4|nr:4-hydroxy-3-methylbut-2-enyl diphosphate reductase [uncultured Slackia sp.]
MRVVRAKHAGVCYGVERALDMAVAAMMDEDDTYTLGPLIHNPTVVKQLEEQGVKAAKCVDDIESGIVVIRSHGVEPHVLQQLKDKGLTVIDATCPHVAKAQRSAGELRDAGGTVVVIGRAEHPEVKGLCGHAGERAVVVADVDELPDELIEPVGIVVQTTESKEKLDSVVEAIRARGIEPVVKNTICFATRQRQNSAADLADEVDAIVVIGGKNSSNTTHLYDICKAHCERSYFIEHVDEIDSAWFEGCETVGVTAGASTPDDQICAVVDYLETL